MAQGQRCRGEDRGRRTGVALAGQDVEDDIGGVDAMGDRLGAGGLSTAVRMSTICRLPSSTPASLCRTRSMAAGSTQSLNGAPLRKAPGLRASTGT
jgi:hypothetical protein